jgi:hypothetical protein
MKRIDEAQFYVVLQLIGLLLRYSPGDARGAPWIIVAFDLVFILLLMENIMKATDVLHQTLEKRGINIISTMDYYVSNNIKELALVFAE